MPEIKLVFETTEEEKDICFDLAQSIESAIETNVSIFVDDVSVRELIFETFPECKKNQTDNLTDIELLTYLQLSRKMENDCLLRND